MKRIAGHGAISAVFVLALVLVSCDSNQYGGSVDIYKICAYEQGAVSGTCLSNPLYSVAQEEPIFGSLEIHNRMSYTGGTGSGQTVRLRRMQIDYRAPNNQSLPVRKEQLGQNVDPGAKVVVPVTLFSYEQSEYIRNQRHLFPAYQFQVNLEIKVYYDTTGGREDTVERFFSVEVTN